MLQVLGDAAFADQLVWQACVLKAFATTTTSAAAAAARTQDEDVCLGTAHISLAELTADRCCASHCAACRALHGHSGPRASQLRSSRVLRSRVGIGQISASASNGGLCMQG